MHKKLMISRNLFVLSLFIGIWVAYLTQVMLKLNIAWVAGVGIVVFAVSYISLGWSLSLSRNLINAFNQALDNTAIEVIFGAITGLLLGVIVGVLSSFPLSMIRGVGNYLTLAILFMSVWLGIKIGTRRAYDVFEALPIRMNEAKREFRELNSSCKVLDTSAIIDGRIYDVCLSSFLDGHIIVPTFVIEELQHIADSSDTIRRNKGRRGLELLSKMQKHSKIKIDIIEANLTQEKDVDGNLICLCKQFNASIITNDYNLNKVAELQGITVLNINELTNAVKMIVYPGEAMHVSIIKEGKESGQGVGYMEDGTMVVVEDAHNEIGRNLEVVVTSVFQTAAGRMIFTRKTKEVSENSGITQSLQGAAEVNVYG